MAELGKGRQIVAVADDDGGGGEGGGGGGEKRRPVGFRFKPGEAEVVEYYLVPRLQGRRIVPNPAIVVHNVYQFEPERLIKEKCKGWIGDEEEWYFLSPRDRKYRNGTRPSRNTEDRVGRWKASTGKMASKQTICSGTARFFVTSLVYFKGPVKTEMKTKWLMREYTIPLFENKLDKSGASTSTSTSSNSDKLQLDQFVLCKIYTSPKKAGLEEEEEEGMLPVDEEEDGWAAACALFELEPDAAEISDKQQAGKRPLFEAAAAGKTTKRPFLPPPAPAQLVGARGVGVQQPPISMLPRPPQPQPQAMMMGNRHQIPVMQGNGMPFVRNFRPAPPVPAYNGHRQQPPPQPMQQGFPVFNHQAQMQQRRPPMQHNRMPPPQPVQRRPIQYRGQAAPVSNNNYHTPPPPQQQQPVQRGPIQYRGQAAPVHNNFHAPPAPVQLLPVHQMQWATVQPQPVRYESEEAIPDSVFEEMLLKELQEMADNYREEQAAVQQPPVVNNDQPQLPPSAGDGQ